MMIRLPDGRWVSSKHIREIYIEVACVERARFALMVETRRHTHQIDVFATREEAQAQADRLGEAVKAIPLPCPANENGPRGSPEAAKIPQALEPRLNWDVPVIR